MLTRPPEGMVPSAQGYGVVQPPVLPMNTRPGGVGSAACTPEAAPGPPLLMNTPYWIVPPRVAVPGGPMTSTAATSAVARLSRKTCADPAPGPPGVVSHCAPTASRTPVRETDAPNSSPADRSGACTCW